MRALTLTQPWASLVAAGAKTIETRSWSTAYRGPLAIHAAKGLGEVGSLDDLRVLCDAPLFHDALWPAGHKGDRHPADGLPRGAIIATCDLADVTTIFGFDDPRACKFGDPWGYDDPEEDAQLARDGWWLDGGVPVAHPNQRPFGHFEEGRYAWFLGEVVPLDEPHPCRGALGLWTPKLELA